jgi:hypothetical protein
LFLCCAFGALRAIPIQATKIILLSIIVMTLLRSFFLAMALTTVVHSFQVAVTPPNNAVVPVTASRRDFFANSFIFAGILGLGGEEAEASARGYHISRKIKAQEAQTREHAPEQALPSGVAIQEFLSGRSGFGELFNTMLLSWDYYVNGVMVHILTFVIESPVLKKCDRIRW